VHNSLPHLFDIAIPSLFLTFILTLTTCSRLVAYESNDKIIENQRMYEDLERLSNNRRELEQQQLEMMSKIRDIEEMVEDE